MNELASYWLRDQSLAFAAALLSVDPFDTSKIKSDEVECWIDIILDKLSGDLFVLSDATLSLVASIDEAYCSSVSLINAEIDAPVERSKDITRVRDIAERELRSREKRLEKTSSMSRVFVSHAVYVLKQRHLSAKKLFRWLQYSSGSALPGINGVVKGIKDTHESVLSRLLIDSRDSSKQTRDRIDAVDRLYEAVLEISGGNDKQIRPWWARICLAYRNSLFCWPLMAYDSSDGHKRGISLPIGLFLLEDGHSPQDKARKSLRNQKTWFKYVLPRDAQESERRRYQCCVGRIPDHMEGSYLGWDKNWGDALKVGMDVAKKLWASQNGRLKYADEAQAQQKLNASLNVDMAPASQIVDDVYGRLSSRYINNLPEERRYFILKGRSAEAYWVQAVLGLLLPAGELPLGVVTGKIEYNDSTFELGVVDGIGAKLDYANRAGFPRIVLPGVLEDITEFDAAEPPPRLSLEPSDGVPAVGEPLDDTFQQRSPPLSQPATLTLLGQLKRFLVQLKTRIARKGIISEFDARENVGDAFPEEPPSSSKLDKLTPKEQVKRFRDKLEVQQATKSIEINFCRNARAAADAMQPAGWRRASFLRTPQSQITYGYNQRRLSCREMIAKKDVLRPEDLNWYKRNRWRLSDEKEVKKLDRLLLSGAGRAIKFVDRSSIRYAGEIEAGLGKWLAWKDHQVRTGDGLGYRGPGLGILCLRTTQHDNEARIWSAVADLLEVDPQWWERFQWSGRDQAANLLADLLGNQRANIDISASSAPDVVVIFDDGAFTQRRTNRIFPRDFHLQFLDLLNPRKDMPGAYDPLDSALRLQGDGPIGPTRIVIIYGNDDHLSRMGNLGIDAGDREHIEKLSVFRFGCPKQAAYSILNYGIDKGQTLTWNDSQAILEHLIGKKLLQRNRGGVFLPRNVVQAIAGNRYDTDPGAHLHAAQVLCPILQPSAHFVASNRDRQLEPEHVLEAAWHLQRAYSLVPNRFRPRHDEIAAAQAKLTFLRSSPDWDTVKRLRVHNGTKRDAIDLARELIEMERQIAQAPPHSSRVGLLIETIGRLHANDTPSSAEREARAQQICEFVERAIDEIPFGSTSDAECRRQLRFLYSRQIYCFRMLGLPLSDLRLKAAYTYIEKAVAEVLEPVFLDKIGDDLDGLDNFPLSQSYWRCMWNDEKREAEHKSLTMKERSSYAYAAARTYLGRYVDGNELRAPWDEPWIQYFKLAKVGEIAPAQLVSPLETWNAVYGHSPVLAKAFGERLLMLSAHIRDTKTGPVLAGIADINSAVANLWDFLSTPSNEERLYGQPANYALNFIRALAMPETMPAFCFIERCDAKFRARWPQEAQSHELDGWSSLAREIVSCDAGWVSMLASLNTDNQLNSSLALVRSWLLANQVVKRDKLHFSDPEPLISNRKKSIYSRYLCIKALRSHLEWLPNSCPEKQGTSLGYRRLPSTKTVKDPAGNRPRYE